MRKIFSLFIFFVFMATVWLWIFGNNFSKNKTTNKEKAPQITDELKKIIKKPGTPVNLSIPRLNINTSIEQVGLDKNGKMDVPENSSNVGWYKLGFKPGEKGSAVIAGHLDTVTGAPSVFYYISTLTKGDKIIITDDKGQTYKFVVTDSKIYSFDQVPLKNVFADQQEAGLNLITCQGVFNNTARNYSHRTIVYSKLVD